MRRTETGRGKVPGSWFTKTSTLIGSVIGFLLGVLLPGVGNAYDLWQKANKPAVEQHGEITNIHVTKSVSFGDFLDAHQRQMKAGLIDSALTSEKLKLWKRDYNGLEISFRATLTGYAGARCPFYWTVFFASNGHEVTRNPTLLFQDGWPSYSVHPTGDKYSQQETEWVPYPGKPGTYFVRLYLYEHIPPQGDIDQEDTGGFSVPSA